MTVESFGTLADGTPIQLATIFGGGLTVEVLNWGAVIRDIRFDTAAGPRSMVLGLNSIADYVSHSPHMGAVAGRFANRIRDGRFSLDGKTYQLPLNQAGRHHLHGGPNGFGKRPWTLVDVTPDAVMLSLTSPDGDAGYPGTLKATCSYRVTGDGTLSIELTAVTDAPTIVNLATHSYFNLDGGDTILDHLIEIPAESCTPLDAELIPTGEIRAVAGTPYDFRTSRPIGYAVDGQRFAYDINFVRTLAPVASPTFAARATGPRSGVVLEVWSTEPGVQFYDATKVNVPVPGLGGRRYGANSGFCLEPQRFADSPNHPHFTDTVLRPGAVYRQLTEYRFKG